MMLSGIRHFESLSILVNIPTPSFTFSRRWCNSGYGGYDFSVRSETARNAAQRR